MFFGFPEKPDPGYTFFCQKLPLEQDGANKKVSQIGPAVPEEIGREHTYIHTNKPTRKHCVAI